MTRTSFKNSLRLAAATFALVGLFSFAPASASAASCKGAKTNPHELSEQRVDKATLCLLNQERRRKGLKKLRNNERLELAAQRHARDMVKRDYFDHDSPDGTDFAKRIFRTNYVSRSSSYRWLIGENLAWGSYNMASPSAIVDAWMNSSGHRANILNKQFREIGIGVKLGAPVDDADQAATYATEFGLRD